MNQSSTLERQRATSPKPRPETIQNILRFSRVYHCQTLANGHLFTSIKN